MEIHTLTAAAKRIAQENGYEFSAPFSNGKIKASFYVLLQGYRLPKGVIECDSEGSITLSEGLELTASEQEAIRKELLSADWPVPAIAENLDFAPLPIVAEKFSQEPFVFYNYDGSIAGLKYRSEGEKKDFLPFVPVTLKGEPMWLYGSLNIPYGLETLKDHKTVLIVEGEKTADAVKKIQDSGIAHPFYEQLQMIAVLAFPGVTSVRGLDWSALKKAGITRAYIVPDNDEIGRSCVPVISKALDCITMEISFPDSFPVSFDLADDFPKSMFSSKGDYIGPSWESLVREATFLTRKAAYVDEKGNQKSMTVLRDHAKNRWVWVDRAKRFAHCELDITVSEEDLDSGGFMPFFDGTTKISQLFKREYGKGNIARFAFLPEAAGNQHNQRVITDGNETSINLYRPIKSPQIKADVTIFLEYLENLVPEEKERKYLLEWAGTLVARPSTRLMYGVLITSNMHGTGKSLFADEILAPLVGQKYVSRPTGDQLAEKFTDWLYLKRLAIVDELYSGTSKRTYNGIKNKMTSSTIDHRTLYSPAITIENRVTVYATSNGDRPLRLDDNDRRFLCIAATEKKWGREKFDAYVHWVRDGGLFAVNYMLHNLEEYGFSYVSEGAEAPSTDRKTELLADSLPDTSRAILDVLKTASEEAKPICFYDGELKNYAENVTGQKAFENIKAIRRLAEPLSWRIGERQKRSGRMQYPIYLGNLEAISDLAMISQQPMAYMTPEAIEYKM